MKFSASTGCFYFDQQPSPDDSINVTDEDMRSVASRGPTDTLAVVDGRVVVVHESGELKLLRDKSRVAEAIKAQAGQSEHAPVQVGPYTMRGGQGSAMDLKGQLDLAMAIAHRMPELNISTVKFYDVAGEEIEVPIESDTEIDAWDIVIAVALQVSSTRFKQVGFERAIARANSKADLDTIKWGE